MAEATKQSVEYADYYECTAGLTLGVHVCSEGEVVEGSAMGFTEENPPLSEEEQVAAYGQVMYKEYDPEPDEINPIAKESRTIRAMMGMQTPDMPPVDPTETTADVPLFTLSRQELRKKAKSLGLNFPEDTDRDQMIGAIEKKQDEPPEDRDEPEPVAKRRAAAKEAIESNNELATGSAGGGGGKSQGASHRRQHAQPREEEEQAK